jgi:hypothetical protein
MFENCCMTAILRHVSLMPAFAYVNAFNAHVNVGFFRGAEIADPDGLLEGTGTFMRHVKLGPERDVSATALRTLVETAYADMKGRLKLAENRVLGEQRCKATAAGVLLLSPNG